MRLLNVFTLELKDFLDNELPLLAILSHTWEAEEVTFKDLTTGDISVPSGFNKVDLRENTSTPSISTPAPSLQGFQKLMGWCEKAKREGFEWVWIDTCCIDKSSSAELSEAINSMYRWYSDADICYAYLSDVDSNEDPSIESSRFRKSRWFTRGWTLQELIAPSEVIFLASDWKQIGTRRSLEIPISEITQIDRGVLRDPNIQQEFSLAQRMSWASRRHTTRIEDQSYSLLGLFGVNMPLIYGEGEKAFLRLQYEILTASDDCSILAWEDSDDPWQEETLEELHSAYTRYDLRRLTGLLASSVRSFQNSGRISNIEADWHVSKEITSPRSDIYIKATKQSVKINAPIYGPLLITRTPHTERYNGFPREAMQYINTNSFRYAIINQNDDTPLQKYLEKKKYGELDYRWECVYLALVAKVPCSCPSRNKEYDTRSGCFHLLGILLDRRPGQLVTRLHFPPLVRTDFVTNQRGLHGPLEALTELIRFWPLTQVSTATVWPANTKPSKFRPPLIMMTPAEFEISRELETSSEEPIQSYCFHFTYNPVHKPTLFQEPIEIPWNYFPITALEFSGGHSDLPTFTIYIEWNSKHFRSWSSVSMVKSAYHENVTNDSLTWEKIEYETITFRLTEEKCIAIARRMGSRFDLYSVSIASVCEEMISNLVEPLSDL